MPRCRWPSRRDARPSRVRRLAPLQQLELTLRELVEALLPLGWLVDLDDFNGRDLVLGTVRRPVRILRRYDVGAGLREVERGVHDAGPDAIGHVRGQYDLARTAGEADHVAVLDASDFGVVRMNLEDVGRRPRAVLRAARLRADVVLRQDPARGQEQRVSARGALVGRHVLGDEEFALPAHEV